MEFETYKNQLKQLIGWNKQVEIKNRNEATTRLHLIDKVLFSWLDWGRENCKAEEAENNDTRITLSTTRLES